MWNALRVPIAFLVAPLMVPLIITAFIAIDHSQILVAQGHTIEGIRLFALGSGIFAICWRPSYWAFQFMGCSASAI